MSEAADAARETEDFFNEEIFGAPPPVDNDNPFPTEAPPEPKPVEELEIDAPEGDAPEGEPAGDEDPDETGDESDTDDDGGALPEPEPVDDEPHLAWARKKFGDGIDLESETSKTLAKAAYEQERLLGKQAEERRRLENEAEQRDLQARIDALNTPGVLTAEEDIWVDEATQHGDPGEYAYDALQAGRPDLYAAVMDRWSSLGETEARRARTMHSQVLQLVSAPQPTVQESYTQALGQTFISLGLNIERDGPLILQKAEELGVAHPAVSGMMSTDEDVRRISTRAIYDLVGSAQTTVQKARTDDVVAQRVQEEELRRNASGIQQGGARVEQPKKSKFWEEFEQEAEERGWNGNRPQYGKE